MTKIASAIFFLLVLFTNRAVADDSRRCEIGFARLPDSIVVDVGTLPLDSKVNFELQLVNSTGQQLRIADVTKDCSCILLSTPESMEFDGNRRARIDVAFRTKKLAGRIGHNLRVYFEGHGAQPLSIQLRALVRGALWLEHQTVDIGGTDKSPIRMNVFLEEGAFLKNVSSLHGFLKVKRVGKAANHAGQICVPVELKPGVVAGNVTEYLRFDYVKNGKEASLDVPVAVRKMWSLRTIR